MNDRLADIRQKLFDELLQSARGASPADSVRLLREALAINPSATAARLMLVQKLIARKEFDEARRVLEPMLASDAAQPDVQQALAEIDVGRGKYEEAIARYERLARRDTRFASRLEEVRREWVAANMPPQFVAALESPAINRADFAILLYWNVAAVRFAQDVGTPPIAVDIDVPGREELIRAIALGIFPVDSVTRRVSPGAPVTSASLGRLAARVLLNRRAACARSVPPEASEASRAQKILASCGISDPGAGHPADAPVSGRAAATMLEQVSRAIGH